MVLQMILPINSHDILGLICILHAILFLANHILCMTLTLATPKKVRCLLSYDTWIYPTLRVKHRLYGAILICSWYAYRTWNKFGNISKGYMEIITILCLVLLCLIPLTTIKGIYGKYLFIQTLILYIIYYIYPLTNHLNNAKGYVIITLILYTSIFALTFFTKLLYKTYN